MTTVPPKLPKAYTGIKGYKLTDSIRQALELPSYLFAEELQNWAKTLELLDVYFEVSLVIPKTCHVLLKAVSKCLRKIGGANK